jgi:predicted HAD superfamily Cof-like phosphohydrolase
MPKSKQELLAPVPRGYLRDWNFKLETMPARGSFEVLRIHSEVNRFDPDGQMVVEPRTGKMFRPVAWRRHKREK